MPMIRCRLYRNGKLIKTGNFNLDALEEDWKRGGLEPLIQPGEFDPNNAHSVVRDLSGLRVITTGGHKLEYIIVQPRKDRERSAVRVARSARSAARAAKGCY